MSADSIDTPLVSVVVATYNMGHYLPLAVASILNQTYQHLEIHVIDDGSSDDTGLVLDRLSEDCRVHVHRQENRGQASAKNRGIRASAGSYIGFLDADDLWLPDKLEKQLSLFAANPRLGVVYSAYECMDADGNFLHLPNTRMHRGGISGQLLIDNFVCFPSALVRRECFDRHGVFDEEIGMGIDYEMWLRLSPFYEFDYLSTPTVRYRIWGGQMSKNFRRRYENGLLIMGRFLDKHPDLISRDVVRTAWAHTYRGRGDTIWAQEGDRKEALQDYLRAVKCKPTDLDNWRAIAKLLISSNAAKQVRSRTKSS